MTDVWKLQPLREQRPFQVECPQQAEARSGSRFPNVEGGLPHSEIAGSKLIRSSPTLIAAYHVLHRLCMPRHPPNALTTLDRSHCRCPSGGCASTTACTTTDRIDGIIRPASRDIERAPRSAHAPWCRTPSKGNGGKANGTRPMAIHPMSSLHDMQNTPQSGDLGSFKQVTRSARALDDMWWVAGVVEPDGIEPTT